MTIQSAVSKLRLKETWKERLSTNVHTSEGKSTEPVPHVDIEENNPYDVGGASNSSGTVQKKTGPSSIKRSGEDNGQEADVEGTKREREEVAEDGARRCHSCRETTVTFNCFTECGGSGNEELLLLSAI